MCSKNTKSEGTTFSDILLYSDWAEQPDEAQVPIWKKEKVAKGPDDADSVGWVRPKVFYLSREDQNRPFVLENGRELPDVVLEYETYGTLNPEKSNAILITHALTGDAHVAGWDSTATETYRPERLKAPGWWDNLVGPGQPFDTDRFFIICSNYLGSCYGSTGPASPNPADGGKPYGAKFPEVSVGDWVRSQERLVSYLGIKQLYAVVGGSIGGLQALEWAIAYPERVGKCILLASGSKLPTQGVGFNYVAETAITTDPGFHKGNIYTDGRVPNTLLEPEADGKDLRYYEIKDRRLRSLHIARMLAHITYLSATGMKRKFGRRLQPVNPKDEGEGMIPSVNGYLNHQGDSFVKRFDANSYILIAKALDGYDAQVKWGDGDLAKACARIQAETMVVSFTSDWLFPTSESHYIVAALMRNHHPVTSVDVESSYGHDAFLVEEEKVSRILRSFLLTPAPARMHTDARGKRREA